MLQWITIFHDNKTCYNENTRRHYDEVVATHICISILPSLKGFKLHKLFYIIAPYLTSPYPCFNTCSTSTTPPSSSPRVLMRNNSPTSLSLLS
jgi:hypothetical protein